MVRDNSNNCQQRFSLNLADNATDEGWVTYVGFLLMVEEIQVIPNEAAHEKRTTAVPSCPRMMITAS